MNGIPDPLSKCVDRQIMSNPLNCLVNMFAVKRYTMFVIVKIIELLMFSSNWP